MDKFVNSTNQFGSQHYKSKWQHLDVSDFQVFLAIYFMFGIVQTDREMSFRDKQLGCKCMQDLMTYDRFSQILRAWHWEDFTNLTKQEKLELRQNSPFYQVESFVDELNSVFMKAYNCHQGISVDEQGVPWKGRHAARQYNKDKPYKRFLKIYSVNCAKSTFQSNSFLIGL